jgi:hypothetical protein
MASVTYSGHVNANDGFTQPVPFAGPPGWTVFKSQQTEIYKITHNLNLTNSQKQLHVVITTNTPGILPSVAQAANAFTITMTSLQGALPQTDFDFIAVHHPKPHP